MYRQRLIPGNLFNTVQHQMGQTYFGPSMITTIIDVGSYIRQYIPQNPIEVSRQEYSHPKKNLNTNPSDSCRMF